jgi:hypothetical protein
MTDHQRGIEQLAEYLCSEFDFSLDPCVGYSWPEHPKDDGYRGDGNWVKLQPSDVQAYARENAGRILAFLSALAPQAGDNAEEPGGDDETESLLIRNLVGVVRKLCKHLPTTDMTRMEAEDFLLRNNLYGSVFRAHPCTSTPVVSQNATDLEDKP